MATVDKLPMLAEGYEKLQTDVRHLKTVERPSIIDAIEEARGHGDLSENAEYHAAKERQGQVEAQIADIEDRISRAMVIDPDDAVGRQGGVRRHRPSARRERQARSNIRSSARPRPTPRSGRISYASPLGPGADRPHEGRGGRILGAVGRQILRDQEDRVRLSRGRRTERRHAPARQLEDGPRHARRSPLVTAAAGWSLALFRLERMGDDLGRLHPGAARFRRRRGAGAVLADAADRDPGPRRLRPPRLQPADAGLLRPAGRIGARAGRPGASSIWSAPMPRRPPNMRSIRSRSVPMVGASGAISAVIGAYAMLFGRNKVKVASPRLALWLNALVADGRLGRAAGCSSASTCRRSPAACRSRSPPMSAASWSACCSPTRCCCSATARPDDGDRPGESWDLLLRAVR